MTFAEKILKSAEEGIVLLKNNDNVLPLTREDSVSIFGRCQFDFYRCGTGSGGSVHLPYSTNLTDCLSDIKINDSLSKLYKQFINDNPFDDGHGVWAGEPFCQIDMDVSEELASECSKVSSKAIYVIGRTAGEDKDYIAEEGSWYLTQAEKNNIRNVCKYFKDVIIVFNTSGIMDTSWIEEDEFKNIKAAVYAWQGGQEAGRACANILTGKAVPGGKLTDTIARHINDYPSTEEFGKLENIYKEDVFVGYRYFNTFARDKILYPFGYGLSYTSFDISGATAVTDKSKITVTVDVKNTGALYAGKEIVQVYYGCKDCAVKIPSVQLVGFAKTEELAPGAKETLTITLDAKDFAIYDDTDGKKTSYCWYIQKGSYELYVGNDSINLTKIKVNGDDCLCFEDDIIIEQLEQCCAPAKSFPRLTLGALKSDGTYEVAYEDSPVNKVDMAERILKNLPNAISIPNTHDIDFDDVKKDRNLLDTFIARLNVKELATIVRGEGMQSQKVTPGIAAAFGGTSEVLHSYKIPCAGCSDGPSGVRMDNGKEADLMPIGTQLACSWNLELVKDLYESEGLQLKENKIDALLGPGINIHRNPLNGRNFEYFSEDPFLTGIMAKVQIEGINKYGAHATIKHFAVNSQETMRRDTNSVVSERALRQIYLKPFEIAVKGRVLKSIMTSYNSINGHWAASNYDMVNMILHKQWGFTGMVMTDWWADGNNCIEGGESSVKNISSMLKARNDIFMVVDNDGGEKNIFNDDLEDKLKDGYLTLGELQLCVKDILNFILDSPVSKRELRPLIETKVIAPVDITVGDDKEKSSYASEVSCGEKFIMTEDEKVLVEVTENGIYDIIGSFRKEGEDVSQSNINLMLNGTNAASFECRSTSGKIVTVTASQVMLSKGFYEVSYAHGKRGIELLSLCVAKRGVSPVLVGVFK